MKNIRLCIRNKTSHLITGQRMEDYVMFKISNVNASSAIVSKLFRNPDDQINRIFIPSMRIIKVKNVL